VRPRSQRPKCLGRCRHTTKHNTHLCGAAEVMGA
jgi:hypothetical protein